MKKGFFLAVAVLGLASILTLPSAALNYGSGTYGGCQYNTCSISIGSSGTVQLNVIPAAGGACTIQSDSVSVLTDDPNGYQLSINNSNTSTALVDLGNSINSISANQSSPAALTADYWGYRVDGVGGFGAGPTSAQTNISPSAALFAKVPPSNATADVIANTSIAADPAVSTTVWYGVCADTSVVSGTYSAQVTYTALTN
jgi:hypothetical protein